MTEEQAIKFMTEFEEALRTDDEPAEKKLRRLETFDPDKLDDIFITLCGWSYTTLKARATNG